MTNPVLHGPDSAVLRPDLRCVGRRSPGATALTFAIALLVMTGCDPASAQWTYLGLAGQRVASLVVAGENLYACTDSGLYTHARAGADTTWSATGLSGRMVLDLAVVSPETLLAAVELGYTTADDTVSVVRSLDGGAHWEPFQRNLVEDVWWTLQVRDLAVGAPPSRTLFALASQYLARSYDAGLSWELSDPYGQMQGQPSVISVVGGAPERLWTRGASIIFAPMASRSLDGGTTWNGSRLWVAAAGDDEGCSAIAADPQAPDVAYAGLQSHGAWKTVDGGSQWALILATGNAITGLAVSPNDHLRVYAAESDWRAPRINTILHVSGDGGATWHALTAPAVGVVGGQALCVDETAPGDRLLLSAGRSGVHAYANAAAAVTGPGAAGTTPGELRLSPNPGNPRTVVAFSLATGGHVRLEILDLAGRRVRALLDTDLPVGEHTVTWDGRDQAGRNAASGTYVVRLSAGGSSRQELVTLVR